MGKAFGSAIGSLFSVSIVQKTPKSPIQSRFHGIEPGVRRDDRAAGGVRKLGAASIAGTSGRAARCLHDTFAGTRIGEGRLTFRQKQPDCGKTGARRLTWRDVRHGTKCAGACHGGLDSQHRFCGLSV